MRKALTLIFISFVAGLGFGASILVSDQSTEQTRNSGFDPDEKLGCGLAVEFAEFWMSFAMDSRSTIDSSHKEALRWLDHRVPDQIRPFWLRQQVHPFYACVKGVLTPVRVNDKTVAVDVLVDQINDEYVQHDDHLLVSLTIFKAKQGLRVTSISFAKL